MKVLTVASVMNEKVLKKQASEVEMTDVAVVAVRKKADLKAFSQNAPNKMKTSSQESSATKTL